MKILRKKQFCKTFIILGIILFTFNINSFAAKTDNPSDLKVISTTDTSVTLTWKDNSQNEQYFGLGIRSETDYVVDDLALCSSNITEITYNNLDPDTTYTFVVYALDSSFEKISDYSNDVTITTKELLPPFKPSNLTLKEANETSVHVTWDDNSRTESGYKLLIQRNDRILREEIILSDTDETESYTIKDLIPDTSYTFKIKSFNSSGESEYSNTIAVKTLKTDSQHNNTEITEASNWAKEEIQEAIEYNLVSDSSLKNFQKNITREEFCELCVNLYESFTQKNIIPVTDNPFIDTNNINTLKAYTAGIITGKTNQEFSPSSLISRQEICVMIARTIKKSIPHLDKDLHDIHPDFNDEYLIAPWAIEEVKFVYANSILRGKDNNLDPLSFTTFEEAIVLVKRTYERFIQLTD